MTPPTNEPIVAPLRSVNPATGESLAEYTPHTPAEVLAALDRASSGFQKLVGVGIVRRAQCLTRVAELLDQDRENLARTMTLEMGKPLRAAKQEIEKCATACRFYATHADRWLRDEPAEAGESRCFTRFQPLGPILAVMPWNFPFWQVFRFAAPALMAGNSGLLKHASNVPQCALAIASLFERAGFPPGSFQALLVGSDRVAEIIADRRVAAVTLTGSVQAGAEVAAAAGRSIKKTVLELGGSDPFVVMPGADLEAAASTAVQARTVNNGQSCIAAKRFIVHEAIAEVFLERFVQRMAALQVGDPLLESTDIGPLATPSVLRDLARQVDQTVAMGARLLLGGRVLKRAGNFYEPTVLTEVPSDSPAFREELFGPVAPVFRVASLQAAVDMANDTEFGLGASIWTDNPTEQEIFIEQVQAGMVFVNGMVASDPRLPFGGIKQSGYGRELGAAGLREFVNTKSVCISTAKGHASATE